MGPILYRSRCDKPLLVATRCLLAKDVLTDTRQTDRQTDRQRETDRQTDNLLGGDNIASSHATRPDLVHGYSGAVECSKLYGSHVSTVQALVVSAHDCNC